MNTQAILELRLRHDAQQVIFDGGDITHAVRNVHLSSGPGEIPEVQLGILSLGGVLIPACLMTVTLVDVHDAIRLRNMLADAVMLVERLLAENEVIPDPQTQTLLRQWNAHVEGPNGESLGAYITRMREAEAKRDA